MKPNNISYSNWIYYNLAFVLQHVLGYKLYRKFLKLKALRTNNLPAKPFKLTIVDKNESLTSTGAPVLFKKGAESWLATKKWSFDFFQENYGEETVLINNTKGVVDAKAPQEQEEIKLRDYIKELKKGSLKYLKLSSLVQKNPSLQKDIDLDWCKKFKSFGSFGETFYMFMGGTNTITPLHNEFPTTLYIQIKGRKKWILYDVSSRIFLDVVTERMPYFYSNFDPLNPNFKSFPFAKHAKKIEVTLEPGDILLVPPFVWHYVQNPTDSIGLAYKFSNLKKGVESSWMLTILFLLSTNPSIIYSFFATRFKKEDYILSKKS
jgi:hypothetical protein